MRELSDVLSVWATTRAAGMTSYLLLFASTLAGLLMTGGMSGKRKAVLLAVHQWSGWFGFLFGLTHGIVLLFDKYVGYSPFELLIPFASDDHRFLNGLGTLTLYVCVVLIASSDLMKRLGRKTWRAIHFLAFAGFGMGWLHGFALGTDSAVGWVRLLYIGTGAAVVALTAVRIYRARAKRRNVDYIPPASSRPPRLERLGPSD
ncbi:ferric reductase-like transmembrane domain-containing protein [Cohnella zeiphila]|uniref:Ferric reductase-like transmembrane domain-containing protein n=1 Tax=Cohnella zeiphila TaxID=2761120 RepID=A0A7X0STV2_9BACL|nr:ferric reductase-like transmembrane domain-containing protein [Cohnella zeiphila]MBB6735029.1 ferric reductase-like transmembrane domain-containing protein [Cohnella zeiphila]